MIYIDPTHNGYFKSLAEVIQAELGQPSEISTDYTKAGTWVLNYVSFKKGVKVNGPYIALQTEQMEIVGNRTYRTWLKGAIKVWDWTDNLWMGYSIAYRLQAERAKDIDVLFYGEMNARRHEIMDQVRIANPDAAVSVVTGRYGRDLWFMIHRAKIVLSIHHYERPQNDMPRIAPLLSNGCFVICEKTVDPAFNSIKELVIVPKEQIAERVKFFLDNPASRLNWADKGRSWMFHNPHINDRSCP